MIVSQAYLGYVAVTIVSQAKNVLDEVPEKWFSRCRTLTIRKVAQKTGGKKQREHITFSVCQCATRPSPFSRQPSGTCQLYHGSWLPS